MADNMQFHLHNLLNMSPEHAAAITLGIDLNNADYQANQNGDYMKALEKYNQAVDIKKRAYGEYSVYSKFKNFLK